ncbi:hypothetical protein OIU92_00085 [Escherichia coli]|nr:hypothetical protein [Escherichia coli]
MPKPQNNAFGNWKRRKQKRLVDAAANRSRKVAPGKLRDMFPCHLPYGRRPQTVCGVRTRGAQPLVNSDTPSQGRGDKPVQTLTDARTGDVPQPMGITGEESSSPLNQNRENN